MIMNMEPGSFRVCLIEIISTFYAEIFPGKFRSRLYLCAWKKPSLCAPPNLSEVSPMFPLKQFHCASGWWWPFLFHEGRSMSAFSSYTSLCILSSVLFKWLFVFSLLLFWGEGGIVLNIYELFEHNLLIFFPVWKTGFILSLIHISEPTRRA